MKLKFSIQRCLFNSLVLLEIRKNNEIKNRDLQTQLNHTLQRIYDEKNNIYTNL